MCLYLLRCKDVSVVLNWVVNGCGSVCCRRVCFGFFMIFFVGDLSNGIIMLNFEVIEISWRDIFWNCVGFDCWFCDCCGGGVLYYVFVVVVCVEGCVVVG